MASERGYESQVGPQGGPAPVMVSPDAFGAEIGRQLEQIGGQAHQNEIRAYQIERQLTADREATQAAQKLAEARVGMAQDIEQLRTVAPDSIDAHVNAVRSSWAARTHAITDGITDDRVRQSVQSQLNDQSAALGEREVVWHAGELVKRTLVAADQTIATWSNAARQGSDPHAYTDALAGARTWAGSLQGVDQSTRDKLLRDAEQSITIGHIRGMFDRGQAPVAVAMIDKGLFNEILDANQLDGLREGGQVEIRRQQAEVEHQQAMQGAALREQVATAEEADRQGIHLPPEQLAGMRDQLAASGDTSGALKLDGIIANNEFARVYEGSTPKVLDDRLAVLAAKDNPTATEQRELEWLRGPGAQLAGAFRSDPVGYMAKYGKGPAPIDWTDPKSVKARADWSRSATRATGQPVGVLSRAEADELQANVATGDKGRRDVLKLLDQLPAVERGIAARQVAPQDPSFVREAQLQPGYRQFVWSGRQKLQGDRTFLTPDKKLDGGQTAAQLMQIFDSEVSFALKGASGGEIEATKRVAASYMAGALAADGRDVNTLRPADIRNAATVALGGRTLPDGTSIGGIAHWAGGQPYVLADGFSQAGFEAAVLRDRRAKEAKGEGPVNPNGTPFDLNNAYPVLVGPGTYRWETMSGALVTRKNGQPYLSQAEAGR